MELGSQCSSPESVEDNHVVIPTLTVSPDGISNLDDDINKVKTNGSCSNEMNHVGASGNHGTNTIPHDSQVKEGVEIEQLGNSESSSPLIGKSPSGSLPPTTKGYGLKKWRRIKRDVVKNTSPSGDNSKVLKRMFNISGNQTKPTNLTPTDMKENSEGSVGSTNVLRNVGVFDGFVTHGFSVESRFVVGSALHSDTENSEDQSSKSSTAASAPRLRHELPVTMGNMWENRLKSLSGKSVGSSSVQRVQQGKGEVENSKKHRGERVKIEKENSHSSMESDSRSSNLVFMQGVYSATGNGKQSGRSMSYDGENSDEVHADEPQFSEEVQTGYGLDHVGEVEDLTQDDLAAEASWQGKGGKNENHGSLAEKDPLADSILNLQCLQEALESEVQKFGEIGKGSNGSEIHEPSSSDPFASDIIRESNSLESQVLSLTENIKNLESILEEAKTMLAAKDSRVAELEATFKKGINEKLGNTTELQLKKSINNEIELEDLFKQKIEAEVEYLALTCTIQKLRVVAGDNITLLEEQEALADEQMQMWNKLGEAESKATMLKKQAKGLEKFCEDILVTEDVLKLQRKVFKLSSCLFLQLIMLVLVIWLLFLQLSPGSGVVVPT